MIYPGPDRVSGRGADQPEVSVFENNPGHARRAASAMVRLPISGGVSGSTRTWSMSASLRKQPKCCVAAKRRYVPQADSCTAAR